MREKQKALRSKAHQPYDLSEIQRNGFGSKEGDSPVANLKGSGQSIAKLKEDFYQEALAELSSSTLLKEQKFYACLSSKSKKSNTEQTTNNGESGKPLGDNIITESIVGTLVKVLTAVGGSCHIHFLTDLAAKHFYEKLGDPFYLCNGFDSLVADTLEAYTNIGEQSLFIKDSPSKGYWSLTPRTQDRKKQRKTLKMLRDIDLSSIQSAQSGKKRHDTAQAPISVAPQEQEREFVNEGHIENQPESPDAILPPKQEETPSILPPLEVDKEPVEVNSKEEPMLPRLIDSEDEEQLLPQIKVEAKKEVKEEQHEPIAPLAVQQPSIAIKEEPQTADEKDVPQTMESPSLPSSPSKPKKLPKDIVDCISEQSEIISSLAHERMTRSSRKQVSAVMRQDLPLCVLPETRKGSRKMARKKSSRAESEPEDSGSEHEVMQKTTVDDSVVPPVKRAKRTKENETAELVKPHGESEEQDTQSSQQEEGKELEPEAGSEEGVLSSPKKRGGRRKGSGRKRRAGGQNL